MDMQSLNPQVLALFMGMLTLLPLLTITCTSFLKISVVLLIVRNAIGIQQVPTNMVIYSISLAATLFIMAPVLNETNNRIQHIPPEKISFEAVYTHHETIVEPLKIFLLKNIDPNTHVRLTEAARKLWRNSENDTVYSDNIIVTLCAFVLSELQSAFKTGFLIYIPFLAVDLIVANILMALGMQMVAPMVISLPVKILLFTLVEGWSRLLEGLLYSYI